MKLPWSEDVRWYALVGGLVATLTLLAVLQYRSVRAVSVTMREQMRANLRGLLMDVREAFEGELRPLCRELQRASVSQGKDGLHEVSLRFEGWRSVAAHPTLVKAVYVWEPSRNSDSNIVKLSASGTAFEPVSWPEDLVRLRARLSEIVDAPGPPDEGREALRHPPLFPQSKSGTVERFHPDEYGSHGSVPDHHEGPDGHPTDSTTIVSGHGPPAAEDRGGDFRRGRQMRPSLWMIDQDVPALVHPIYAPSAQNTQERRGSSIGWIVIVLDRAVLAQHILPELIQRYFGTNEESSYAIAVMDRNERAPDLYVSDPKLKSSGVLIPDAALNLFGRPAPTPVPGEPLMDNIFVPAPQGPERMLDSGDPRRFPGENPDEGPPSLIVQPIHYPLGQEWEILAKHRLGSVDAAVAVLSRRNLAFNLGVLAVLAATMAMIIAASLRARRFGRLQMDFVANVSHELRTPLTGIVAAAENMADGLIDDKQKVAIYGKAIIREAQQLSDLVEQILQFSAIHKNGNRYHFQPVDVVETLQFTLKNTSALIESAGIKVEQQIESGLPPISADFKALSRCLQNLIGNAVKYGGDERWIGIRAWMESNSKGRKELCIAVADRGIGIRPEDLDHIFEPFYRASKVTEAQIHGTGLGLPLARKIAEAMDGSITVESEVGKGSTFTLHLPLK